MRLRQLFEEAPAKKIVAIMPGGFHPFHPGHKSLYDWAVNTFGAENVYVAATNDTTSRPFPFDVKVQLAQMAGVPSDKFIQVKSPFNALAYDKQIGDASQTALVFVRSEKDKTSHPLPDQVRKSDGNMGYLISYTGDNDLETADTHGYLAYGPTIDFDFSGMQIKSASELRAAWPQMAPEEKMQAAELMYPNNAQTAVELLDKALGTEPAEEPVKESNSNLDPGTQWIIDNWVEKTKDLDPQIRRMMLLNLKDKYPGILGRIKESIKKVKEASRQGRQDGPASARPQDSMLDAPKDVRMAAARGADVSRDSRGNYSASSTDDSGTVTTTTNNRVKTSSDAGTTVRDRSGRIRSQSTPNIGGFQAKRTFRPDGTPGYDQATYKQGAFTVSQKGSPETGYTRSNRFSAGPVDVTKTDRYSGQSNIDTAYTMGDKTIRRSRAVRK